MDGGALCRGVQWRTGSQVKSNKVWTKITKCGNLLATNPEMKRVKVIKKTKKEKENWLWLIVASAVSV